METNHRIALIGAGKLGSRIARRILQTGVCESGELAICRGDRTRLVELTETIPGCRPATCIGEAMAGAQLVILAVRPADLEEAGRQIRPALLPNQTVLSVVTGKSFATLSRSLGTTQLLRASTSILLETGQARTVFMAHPQASRLLQPLASSVIASWGQALETENEADINVAVVAIGALPGLAAYILQGCVEGLESLGWSPERAHREVLQTTMQLCQQAQAQGLTFQDIFAAVATKGGITRAGGDTMDELGVRSGTVKGIQVAYQKTNDLDG